VHSPEKFRKHLEELKISVDLEKGKVVEAERRVEDLQGRLESLNRIEKVIEYI
jgi:hypothetical protein